MPLNYYNGNKKLDAFLQRIKMSLGKPGVYYSLYYKPDKLNPKDVQLFILDVKSQELSILDIGI